MLHAENERLTIENDRIRAELRSAKLNGGGCDKMVLCQHCVHGIRRIETVVLSNGETLAGPVACKLCEDSICIHFEDKAEVVRKK